MQRQMTHSAVIERARIASVSETGSDDALAAGADVLALAPGERPLAVLAVIATESERLELELRLGAAGYVVWAVSTGREALELAEQGALDAIVLDLDGLYEASRTGAMISGFRLLHLLWRLTRERPVAMVVITNLDYTEVEGPVRASADDFINKPVMLPQLLRRLQSARDRVRARHQRSGTAASPA